MFADGKTNRAVGVAAVPESIEFIQPGQTHARLGEGIADAVVLSAGDRLQTLRERVQVEIRPVRCGTWTVVDESAGGDEVESAQRPVCAPDGVLYVANADHEHCAAERPYVKVDLKKLVSEMSESAQHGILQAR